MEREIKAEYKYVITFQDENGTIGHSELVIPEGYDEVPSSRASESDYHISNPDTAPSVSWYTWYSNRHGIPALDDNVGDINDYRFIKKKTIKGQFPVLDVNKVITSKDLTIRELQTRLPWTIKYSGDFRANPQAHKDFAHGLVHIIKAAGKLSEFVDDMDHNRDVALGEDTKKAYGKYIADMVICALRMANTFPNGMLDLQREVQNRLENKNNVKL